MRDVYVRHRPHCRYASPKYKHPKGLHSRLVFGCGCPIYAKLLIRHPDPKIPAFEFMKVEPADGPANGVSTCIKGKFAWDFVNSQDRLTTPLIREGDRFREASWDEALDVVATRLAEIKQKNGADALGFISSSKCTNEESYLMQKLARAVIGTNNVDNCSRYCQAPATAGLFRTVGYGGDSGSS